MPWRTLIANSSQEFDLTELEALCSQLKSLINLKGRSGKVPANES